MVHAARDRDDREETAWTVAEGDLVLIQRRELLRLLGSAQDGARVAPPAPAGPGTAARGRDGAGWTAWPWLWLALLAALAAGEAGVLVHLLRCAA